MKMTLNLYTGKNGGWVFDDSRFNIQGEALGGSLGSIIQKYVTKPLPKFTFSDEPFIGFQSVFTLVSDNNYVDTNSLDYSDDEDNLDYPNLVEGVNVCWINDQIISYFDDVPKDIYFSIE